MAMMMGEDFQYVLRILGTNVDGRQKVMYAMTSVKGIGRRLSCLICKKADVDLNKRAGELTNDEVDTLITIVQNPRSYKIPDWFLNRQKDNKDGKYSQVRRATVSPHLLPSRRAAPRRDGTRTGGTDGARGQPPVRARAAARQPAGGGAQCGCSTATVQPAVASSLAAICRVGGGGAACFGSGGCAAGRWLFPSFALSCVLMSASVRC